MAKGKGKKPSGKATFAQKIRKAQLATTNALKKAAITKAMANFGYTKTKIEVGKKIAESALAFDTKQKAFIGKQHGATQELTKKIKQGNKVYATTLDVARVAFKGQKEVRTALLLGGTRKKSVPGQIDQAEKLYGNILANDTYMTTMKEYGYNKPKLQSEYKIFKDVAKLDNAQERAKSSAQKATKDRDAKVKKLNAWMSDFIRIAKRALSDNKQALEALGITAR